MRVVLYTEDLEPITVLDLPSSAMQRLTDGGRWRVAVFQPFRLSSIPTRQTPVKEEMKIVEIWAEKFVRKGREQFFLFTRDEVAALMLRSTLLPGQHKDVQAREREQYMQGFLRGLTAVLGD